MQNYTLGRLLRSSDPLDANIADVDTSYPVIPAKMYSMVVKSAEKKQNKAGTGDNAVIVLATTEEATSVKGIPIPAGYTITHRISLTQTDKYPKASIDRALAAWAKSCGVSHSDGITVNGLAENPGVLTGRTCIVSVGISPAQNGYPESNGVKSFVPPGN